MESVIDEVLSPWRVRYTNAGHIWTCVARVYIHVKVLWLYCDDPPSGAELREAACAALSIERERFVAKSMWRPAGASEGAEDIEYIFRHCDGRMSRFRASFIV
jgi:hypothetical protein